MVTSGTIRLGRCRDDIHGAQVGTFLGQDGGHFCEHAWCVGKFKANGQAVIGVGFNVRHGWSFISH